MKDFKKYILLVAVVLFAVPLFAQDQTAAITAYNEARDLAQSKQYDAAIEKYQEAMNIAGELGADGEDIKSRSEKAIPKLYYSKAVDTYNGFRSSPSIPNLDAAIAEFEEAQKVGNDSGDTQIARKSQGILAQLNYQKGIKLFKREDFEGSEEALDAAIQINPNYAKAYYQKALVHKKTSPEDVDGIMSWFDQAISVAIQVNDREVERSASNSAHDELLFRGSKLVQDGKSSQAIELLEMALTYNEESADANYRLAEANNKLERYDSAISYANKALELEPGGSTDKAKIYFEIGIANQMKGNKGKACEAFTNASYGSFKAPSEHKMEFELKCESAEPSDN